MARRPALLLLVFALLATPRPAVSEPPAWAAGPMRVGIGDRLTVLSGGEWVSLAARAERAGVRPDYLQIWLTRGWRATWVPREGLHDLAERGITPVFVHYFFGDEISRERIVEEREAWHASLRRMARIARTAGEALVVLEPEFNINPPPGETATVDWPGFADEVRAALRVIRAEAPRLKVGICAGDFYPDLNLQVLDAVAGELDFLAFQEMRGATDPVVDRSGYLRVGREAVRYARYLRGRFGKPILLGYVAVSSYGPDWETRQQEAILDLVDAQAALLEQGVFGIVYFQLQDDPEHRGYFGPAEREFGLIDARGRAKPAFRAFLRLLERPAASPATANPRHSPTPPTPR